MHFLEDHADGIEAPLGSTDHSLARHLAGLEPPVYHITTTGR